MIVNWESLILRNSMNFITNKISRRHIIKGLFSSTALLGLTTGGSIKSILANATSRGFVSSYMLEKLSLGLPFLSAVLVPGPTGWGRGVAEAMEKYKCKSVVWICGENSEQSQNRITLHKTEKDKYGLPASVVSKTPHVNDVNMANHEYITMKNIYDLVGLKEIYNSAAYPASHNIGTNRMSKNPRDGVVNKWGQAHDVKNLFVSDGSQFTSSGSENFTLKIVALAIRQAEYLGKASKSGELKLLSSYLNNFGGQKCSKNY